MRVALLLVIAAVCALAQVTEDDAEYPTLHAQFLRAHSHKFYDPDDPARVLSCKNLPTANGVNRWSCMDQPYRTAYPGVTIRCGIYFVDKDTVFGKHCKVYSYSSELVLVDGVSDAVPLPPHTEEPEAPEEPPVDDAPPDDTNATVPEDVPEVVPEDADSEGYGAPEELPEDDGDSSGEVAQEGEAMDSEHAGESTDSAPEETNYAPPPMSVPRRRRGR